MLEHVRQDNTLTVIYHCSICVIYDLPKAANYKLCFLSEEKLFSLIVDLNRTILATLLCVLPDTRKTKLDGETTIYSPRIIANFFRHPV